MKTTLCAMVLVGLAASAQAEVNTRVDVLLSLDGGPLTSSLAMPWGTGMRTVDVVISMSYIGSGTALGFASAVFQPTVSNWGATDIALGFVSNGLGSNTTTPSGAVLDTFGQYGRISPFARSALATTTQALFNHVHSGGAGGAPAGNWLRVSQRSATGWIGGAGNTTGGSGVPVAQLANVGRTASDPAFNPGVTSVHVFRFGVSIDTSNPRSMTFEVPLAGFGNRSTTTGERQVFWWGDLNASTGDLRGTAVVAPAFIIVPAPVSLVALSVGAMRVVRRRW